MGTVDRIIGLLRTPINIQHGAEKFFASSMYLNGQREWHNSATFLM